MDFSRFVKATVAFDFLATNSTTHRNAFSAMAELVDNAYDASAKNLHINFVDEHEMFEILDDGEGMSHEETVSVVSFGYSKKKAKNNQIGRYGNGLKSGGLHLGTELLILTKKQGVLTALLISHRFHEDHNLKSSVFVPCPSFELNFAPLVDTAEARERFNAEMAVIEDYAPLGGLTLQQQFLRIQGPSGTLILIGGVKRSVTGDFCFRQSGDDLILEESNVPYWQASLHNYLSILYLEPKMKIFLRGKEIVPKKLTESWMEKRVQSFNGCQFKAVYNLKMREHDENIKRLEEEHSINATRVGELNSGIIHMSRESRLEDNKTRERHRISLEAINKAKAEKKKAMERRRNDETFYLHCGVKLVDRKNYGINFYMNKRLIIANYTDNKFYKNPDSVGICMCVDLSYNVFLPTHDKQGFDAHDFALLNKKCHENLNNYLSHLQSVTLPAHLEKHWNEQVQSTIAPAELTSRFWSHFGYKKPIEAACVQQPLTEKQKGVVKSECGEWKLCDACRKWRNTAKTPMRKNVAGKYLCSGVCNERSSDNDNFQQLVVASVPQRKTASAPIQKSSRRPSSTDDCVIMDEPTSSSSRSRIQLKGELKNEPSSANNSYRDILVEVKREESSARNDEEGMEYFTEISRQINALNGEPSSSQSTARAQAKKSATKRSLGSRRGVYVESSDEEDSEYVDEREVAKKKTKKTSEEPKQNRISELETFANAVLKEMGYKPTQQTNIPKLDVAQMMRAYAKKKNEKSEMAAARAESTNETMCKMLESMETHFGGVVPGMPCLKTTPDLMMDTAHRVILFLDKRPIPKKKK